MEHDTYSVLITRPAEADLAEIDDYISVELGAPVAAERLMDAMEAALVSLSFSPQGHPRVRDDRLAAQGYRWIGIKNYVAFYTIDAPRKTVRVERILYGRRNWQHLL